MRSWIFVLTATLIIAIVVLFSPSKQVSGSGDHADAVETGGPLLLAAAGGRSDPMYSTIDGTRHVDICSQHPQICPLDPDTWQGEPDAWLYTAKKWQRHTDTPSGINVMWESSFPYSGSNPVFVDHRENHYTDYTNTPDEYPVVTGTTPIVYDWERWAPIDDTYKLEQFGKSTERLSPFVGETDCDSGLYFPLIDHNLSYAYTSMFFTRRGECIGDSYIATQRVEMWGEPLSPLRIDRCDNQTTGIPADQSSKGNITCKLSPYVALAYTRYVNGAGPGPEDIAVVGCEATVYAWGWPKPQNAGNTGQDYEGWFRNGLLRFSKWFNLTDRASEIPAPDDHAWWNSECERAWSGITNWVHAGRYRIGSTVYTDTISLPTTFTTTIATSGGTFTSTLDNTLYTFPPGTFTGTVIVTHTIRPQIVITLTENPESGSLLVRNNLIGTHHFFELDAVHSDTGQSAQPTQPYTVAVQYSDAEKGVAMENTLALYYEDGSRWVKEPTSVVLTATHTVIATPNHLSQWAVLGMTWRMFLPLVQR